MVWGFLQATEVFCVSPLSFTLCFPQKATWSLRLIFFQIVFGTLVPLMSAFLMASLSLEANVYVSLLSFDLF